MSHVSSKVSQDHKPLRHKLFLLLVVSLSLAQIGFAQRTKTETYKILGISVEGTNSRTGTDPGAIIANSGLKTGDEITLPGDQIRQAIQHLWALRIFADVQILVENKVENGLYLVIKVTEYPRFERLEVKGADDVSEDDIRKKANLVKGQILTPDDVTRIVNNVKKLYGEEGHLLAEVKTESALEDTGKPNHVVLTIEVDEGPSVTIGTIHVAGNSAINEDDLKGQLSDTQEKTWWQFWSHPKFDKKKYEADKQKLMKYYRKSGYLDAEIVSDTTWYTPDKKHISVLINVSEGEQYKIRSVTWEGNTVYKPEVLNERLQFLPGDLYDEEKFEQNLRGNQEQTDVASLYLDNGYLTFNLDPEEKRVAEDSLDITIRVYERNQFRIGHGTR